MMEMISNPTYLGLEPNLFQRREIKFYCFDTHRNKNKNVTHLPKKIYPP